MTYKIETNIIGIEFQQRMREAIHDHLTYNPTSMVKFAKEIGITRFTLHKFLFREQSLRAKESYAVLKFLQGVYADF